MSLSPDIEYINASVTVFGVTISELLGHNRVNFSNISLAMKNNWPIRGQKIYPIIKHKKSIKPDLYQFTSIFSSHNNINSKQFSIDD